jgi:hypothetical protein
LSYRANASAIAQRREIKIERELRKREIKQKAVAPPPTSVRPRGVDSRIDRPHFPIDRDGVASEILYATTIARAGMRPAHRATQAATLARIHAAIETTRD